LFQFLLLDCAHYNFLFFSFVNWNFLLDGSVHCYLRCRLYLWGNLQLYSTLYSRSNFSCLFLLFLFRRKKLINNTFILVAVSLKLLLIVGSRQSSRFRHSELRFSYNRLIFGNIIQLLFNMNVFSFAVWSWLDGIIIQLLFNMNVFSFAVWSWLDGIIWFPYFLRFRFFFDFSSISLIQFSTLYWINVILWWTVCSWYLVIVCLLWKVRYLFWLVTRFTFFIFLCVYF